MSIFSASGSFYQIFVVWFVFGLTSPQQHPPTQADAPLCVLRFSFRALPLRYLSLLWVDEFERLVRCEGLVTIRS